MRFSTDSTRRPRRRRQKQNTLTSDPFGFFGVARRYLSSASVVTTTTAVAVGPQKDPPTREACSLGKSHGGRWAAADDCFCWIPPPAAAAARTRTAPRDHRLPLALQSRRRKRLRQHQFDDAPEEEATTTKKKKKRRLLIIFDDDDDDVSVEEHKGPSVVENISIKTTAPTPQQNKLAIAVAHPAPKSATAQSAQAAAEEQTKEITGRSVTPLAEEEGGATTVSPASNNSHYPPKTDVQQLLERLSQTCCIDKPRKNRIDPHSQFANAMHEVQDEEDDDSVGSGIGAATTTPSTTNGSLMEWFLQQQQLKETTDHSSSGEVRMMAKDDEQKSFASIAQGARQQNVSSMAVGKDASKVGPRRRDAANGSTKEDDYSSTKGATDPRDNIIALNDKAGPRHRRDVTDRNAMRSDDQQQTKSKSVIVDLSSDDDDDVQINPSAEVKLNSEQVKITREGGQEIIEIIESSGAESDDEMEDDDESEDRSADDNVVKDASLPSTTTSSQAALVPQNPERATQFALATGTGSARSKRAREVSQSPRDKCESEENLEFVSEDSIDGALLPTTATTTTSILGRKPRVSTSPLPRDESKARSSDDNNEASLSIITGRVLEVDTSATGRSHPPAIAASPVTEPVGRTRARLPREVSRSPTAREDEATPSSEENAFVTDSSDSSVCNEVIEYTYGADTPVGICERICKNDEMRAWDLESENQKEDGSTIEPYPLETFLDLWRLVEDQELLVDAELIEHSGAFRAANLSVSNDDSAEQGAAQYGRILPNAMDRIFREIMGVRKENVFVDLGHGIGNACLQASYTIGCRARGVELVDARFYASEAFRRCLAKVAGTSRNNEHLEPSHAAGLVELKHGRLEDPAYHNWLASADRVFVNNFHDVFGSRSKCKSDFTIDSRIAALFAAMEPGSVLATMHPIADLLGRAQDDIMEIRNKHGMHTPCPEQASFFKMEKLELGPANETVSWSQYGGNKTMIMVYKYTRLEQSSDNGQGVFVCTNHQNCERARSAQPIPATKRGEGGLVLRFCDCKFTAIGTRGRKNRRPNNKYSEYDCN